MKTLEEIKAMRDELAEKYCVKEKLEDDPWYEGGPQRSVGESAYSAGFDAALELMLEREKDCKHPGCCCVCGHQGKCPECGPTAGISEAICD